MADITMCVGNGCPKKDDCYRYTAVKNEYRQAYFVSLPYDFDTDKCELFTPNFIKDKDDTK